ncbi:GNAT family N-acetyltransferase [Tistrella mobilis]|uniref:N-acetyltransferase domain-containing protein n=1 Tax=Tistrella mobilis TaxID=171437 RepID=A0A162L0L3_9PROT|nr:GNAT family N-acetyltransferase [Tistrella mobilis]KYO52621.1 hypothetical protein AUP44_04665 [Tistrella mobilis]
MTPPPLSLRAPRPGDAAALQALVSDPEVALPTAAIPHPYPPGGAAAHLADLARESAAGREIAVAVIDGPDPETGRLIGMVTLRLDGEGGAALGYVLGRAWWGRGLMTEAVRRVLLLAREHPEIARIEADVMVPNTRSAAVLTRLGFTETGRARAAFPARGREVEVRQFIRDLGKSAR